jgi:transcriptional regulator with XRE-family HTH domain
LTGQSSNSNSTSGLKLAEAVGDILARERRARDLSVATIAERADIDGADVVAIENGDGSVDFHSFVAYALHGLGLSLAPIVREADALARNPHAVDEAAAADMPGAFQVPIGPPAPQFFLTLIPRRLRGTIALIEIHDGGGGEEDVEAAIIGEGSEQQLRDLGSACHDVADWLHQHSSS